MKVSVDFEDLDTFNCIYGEWGEGAGILRVYVRGGLALPYGVLLKEDKGVRFVRCEKDKAGSPEDIFPRHYIYDPSRRTEYVEWTLNEDELLKARAKTGEWVEYTSTADSQYAMHEFVGECWFVFDGVSYAKNTTISLSGGIEQSDRNGISQDFGSLAGHDADVRQYFLEGTSEIEPGPGWVSWEIHAKSFYIEIPDA